MDVRRFKLSQAFVVVMTVVALFLIVNVLTKELFGKQASWTEG